MIKQVMNWIKTHRYCLAGLYMLVFLSGFFLLELHEEALDFCLGFFGGHLSGPSVEYGAECVGEIVDVQFLDSGSPEVVSHAHAERVAQAVEFFFCHMVKSVLCSVDG